MSTPGGNTPVGSANGDDVSVVSEQPATNPTNQGRTMEVRLPQPARNETLVLRFQSEVTDKSENPKRPYEPISLFSRDEPSPQFFANYSVGPDGSPKVSPNEDKTRSIPFGSKWLTARWSTRIEQCQPGEEEIRPGDSGSALARVDNDHRAYDRVYPSNLSEVSTPAL